MMPEYLICTDPQNKEQLFVLKTSIPKMLCERTIDEEKGHNLKPVILFDPLPNDAQLVARMMREMGDWYFDQYLSS